MQNSISEAVSELRRQIELADAIVVGGASGMSAASGFRFYYMDDDTYKKTSRRNSRKIRHSRLF